MECSNESKPENIDDSQIISEICQIEEIRASLEKSLSLPIFKDLYKILEENVNFFIIFY